MKYDLKNIKKALKDNYNALATEYQKELENSYRKKVMNTQPGQPAPEKKLTDMEAAAFSKRVYAYKQRAEDIINNVKGQIAADATAAPTPEAATYISILSKREHIRPSELQFAANAYGQNFASYAAIQELAAKNKIYLDDHPTMKALEDVEAFEQNNKYYTIQTLSDPKHTPETTARLYAAGIDGGLFMSEEGEGGISNE